MCDYALAESVPTFMRLF